jgi:peptide deformylase
MARKNYKSRRNSSVKRKTLSPSKQDGSDFKMHYYPDSVLRRKSESITDIGPAWKETAEKMAGVMLAQRGIGISGPQVGVYKRIIVVNLSGLSRDNVVLLNPRITGSSEEKWSAKEGCLSFPGITVNIERPKRIFIEADSFEGGGDVVTLELKDWGARVVMHEIDHLDGVLLIDHALGVKRDIIKRKMNKFNRANSEV